jgi:hypothetical protein
MEAIMTRNKIGIAVLIGIFVLLAAVLIGLNNAKKTSHPQKAIHKADINLKTSITVSKPEQPETENYKRLKKQYDLESASLVNYSKDNKQFDKSSRSTEYKLASLNAGRYIPENDISVARFRSLLKQLSSTYIEDETKIADITVSAQSLLKNNGINESLINLMEGMNQLFTTKNDNQKYAEYISAYCVFRNKGQSHYESIQTLQAMITDSAYNN